MTISKLIQALNGLKVETGSLACMGCGHEHNCSTQGCAIIREAMEQLKLQQTVFNEEAVLKLEEQALGVTPGCVRLLAKNARERNQRERNCYRCNSKDSRERNSMKVLQYKFCPECGRDLRGGAV